ncbi:hypothetical protein NEMIN01_0385 [Nematocida minor]|uniref:uncharacterized protein n=1 Tax=Nematocida minor TaxID=1912983 RepID=UPI00221EE067|nr:uncharacterized protein NEMIN01_0385 [Nematocida minor]KAI5189219.1 hypothetical protein NEMIN01_0385 [Nematocida minor]
MEYHVFKHPYILIEDATGKHRPFHKEYSRDSKDTLIPEISLTRQAPNKKIKAPKKTGICELCVAKYSDYESHIKTPKHSHVESNIMYNYAEIDALSEKLKMKRLKKRETKKRLFIE